MKKNPAFKEHKVSLSIRIYSNMNQNIKIKTEIRTI